MGALGLSICLSFSFDSTPIFTDIRLVGFRVPPSRTCNVGDDVLAHVVMLAAGESAQ